MAMTLRLTEAEDAALELAARRRGISKQEAAREAVRRYADEDAKFMRYVHEAIDKYGPVLEELAHGPR